MCCVGERRLQTGARRAQGEQSWARCCARVSAAPRAGGVTACPSARGHCTPLLFLGSPTGGLAPRAACSLHAGPSPWAKQVAACCWAVGRRCPVARGSARAAAEPRSSCLRPPRHRAMGPLKPGHWNFCPSAVMGELSSHPILCFALLMSWRHLCGRGMVLVKADMAKVQRAFKLKSKVHRG